MNFSYGVIAVVGILVAISLGLIAVSPDDVMKPRAVIIEEDSVGCPDEYAPDCGIDKPERMEKTLKPLVTIETGSTVPLSTPGCKETDECYTPSSATVDVGGKVIMTNTDDVGIHTYTSGTVDGFAASPDDIFDSGLLSLDQSFEWSPDTAGEYPYYCILHVWMQGTIIVQDAKDGMKKAMENKQMEKKAMESEMES